MSSPLDHANYLTYEEMTGRLRREIEASKRGQLSKTDGRTWNDQTHNFESSSKTTHLAAKIWNSACCGRRNWDPDASTRSLVKGMISYNAWWADKPTPDMRILNTGPITLEKLACFEGFLLEDNDFRCDPEQTRAVLEALLKLGEGDQLLGLNPRSTSAVVWNLKEKKFAERGLWETGKAGLASIFNTATRTTKWDTDAYQRLLIFSACRERISSMPDLSHESRKQFLTKCSEYLNRNSGRITPERLQILSNALVNLRSIARDMDRAFLVTDGQRGRGYGLHNIFSKISWWSPTAKQASNHLPATFERAKEIVPDMEGTPLIGRISEKEEIGLKAQSIQLDTIASAPDDDASLRSLKFRAKPTSEHSTLDPETPWQQERPSALNQLIHAELIALGLENTSVGELNERKLLEAFSALIHALNYPSERSKDPRLLQRLGAIVYAIANHSFPVAIEETAQWYTLLSALLGSLHSSVLTHTRAEGRVDETFIARLLVPIRDISNNRPAFSAGFDTDQWLSQAFAHYTPEGDLISDTFMQRLQYQFELAQSLRARESWIAFRNAS